MQPTATCRMLYFESIIRGVVAGGAPTIAQRSLGIKTANDLRSRALLAAYPALTTWDPTLDGAKDTDLARQGIVYGVGSAADYYQRSFVPSIRVIDDAFGRYQEGGERLKASLARVPHDEQVAWENYQARLRARGLDPVALPRRFLPTIIDQMRGNHVPVPSTWNGMDRQVFSQAYRHYAISSSQEFFAFSTQGRFGTPLPPGLDRRAFVRQAGVQKLWHRILRAPEGIEITPDLTPENVRTRIWPTALQRTTDLDLAAIRSADTARPMDPVAALDAEVAANLYVASAMALALSICGMALHTTKLLIMLVRRLRPTMHGRLPICAACVAMMTALSVAREPSRVPLDLGISDSLAWVVAAANSQVYPIGVWLQANARALTGSLARSP